jgi:hypothetical protein
MAVKIWTPTGPRKFELMRALRFSVNDIPSTGSSSRRAYFTPMLDFPLILRRKTPARNSPGSVRWF